MVQRSTVMKNGVVLVALALVLVWATAAAAAALPQPGLWIGTKNDVQLSFTVRASGSRRIVTDVVTMCGNVGSIDLKQGNGIDPSPPETFAVGKGGRIPRWSRDHQPVLRATTATVDSRTFIGTSAGIECPIRDFKGIHLRRGDFRPIQDGRYEGESGEAYDFGFSVAGGGVLVTRFVGYAGVPDPTSLLGYCGPSGAIADDGRIGSDGSFTSAEPGSDGRQLVIHGVATGTSVSGTYTYNAPEHCVGGGALSGSVDWSATLTAPAPGSAPTGTGAPAPLPPGPEGAPDAPDPKPAPNNGYAGPPAAQPGCTTTVSTGPIAAIAACFRSRGTRSESTGRVRLNGIDLTPARAGVTIAIDRRTRAISSTGPVEVRIGSLSLVRSSLDWKGTDTVFEITGASKRGDPGQPFSAKGQGLFGLAVKGSAKVRLEGGRTKLTVSLTIPKDQGPVLSRLSGYSGEMTAAADNQSGLVLDGAKISFPGMRAGFVEIQSAQLAVARVGDTYHFDGGATVFPFRLNRIGFSGTFGFGLDDGYFQLGAAVEQLNRSLVYGFFLQKIGFAIQANPFGISGSAGVTFGPQFRLGGDLVSVARLDGSLAYLSGSSGDPASLTLAGALELAEAKAADGSVEVRGDGSVTAKGTFALTVGGYGLKGALDGWFDGARAFEVQGDATLSLPGPDGGGEAILSSAGAGACRRGFGPDVGFGYEWGKGLSGITFAAGSCSLGQWRAQRGGSRRASAAAAGSARTVTVPRGRRQLAVQLVGIGGAPAVAVTAPDGRRIDTAAGEVADDSTLLVQDADTHSTYLVVDGPKAGRWRIEPLAGTPPIAALRTAAPLPHVTVRGSVRRSGSRRVVTYRVRGLAGRRLQLVDEAGRARRTVRSSRRASGRIRFTPAPGGGRHRLVAVVLGPHGIPTGATLPVATYRVSTARPPKPGRVRVRRAGTGRTVTWRGSSALHYEVDVRTSDGRRLRLLPRGRRHAVTVAIVPRGVRVRATVRARDDTGRLSRAVIARG